MLSIPFFALGALSGTLLFLLAYLTELRYGNGDWKDGQWMHDRAYIPAVFGAALFAVGMIVTAVALHTATSAQAPSAPANEVQHPQRAPDAPPARP